MIEVCNIKNLPNIITSIRVVLSLLLLLTEPLSLRFFIIYFLCGISDVADGYIARKTKSASQFGALLDSIADAVFIVIYLIIFIPMLQKRNWIFCWIGFILIIRFLSLTVGFIKYHTFAPLHIYSNKATGLLLFVSPFLFSTLGLTITISSACVLATISAVEELMINLTSKELSRDVKSIFLK